MMIRNLLTKSWTKDRREQTQRNLVNTFFCGRKIGDGFVQALWMLKHSFEEIRRRTNKQTNKRKKERNKQAIEWTNQQTYKKTKETNEFTRKWTNEKIKKQMNVATNKWINQQTNKQTYK
jgi:hypothetical protein